MYYINVEFDDSEAAPRRDALRDFGFDENFLRDYLGVAEPGELPARIVAVHRGRYAAVLRGLEGELLEVEALPAGRLSHEARSAADLPAVGDWVVLRIDALARVAPSPSLGGPAISGPPDAGASEAAPGASAGLAEVALPGAAAKGPALVTSILPRRSVFARKAAGEGRAEAQILAANVDTAFIVAAAGHDFNPRRIERYLALAWESGVEPVIVITKADLAEDPEALVEEASALAWGTPCFAISAPEGRGLEHFSKWLRPGRTVVLLGSSGAGKSTLLNALAGRELAAVNAVREDDQRGRHTTTHRELYRLESGALVIDSPGMRELQLWAGEEAVEASFADIEALSGACRFRDCGHEDEPGCAVRAALEAGELDPKRYASYRKLMREVSYLERKDDLNLRRAEADRWRAINKSMRGYSKERRAIQGSAR